MTHTSKFSQRHAIRRIVLVFFSAIFALWFAGCSTRDTIKNESYVDQSMKDVPPDTSINNGEVLVKKGDKLELYAAKSNGLTEYFTMRTTDGDVTGVIEVNVPTSIPDKKHPDPPKPKVPTAPPVAVGCEFCQVYSDGHRVCVPVTCPDDPGPIRPQ